MITLDLFLQLVYSGLKLYWMVGLAVTLLFVSLDLRKDIVEFAKDNLWPMFLCFVAWPFFVTDALYHEYQRYKRKGRNKQ